MQTLTDEQELAASRRQGSMLLTAAAGSGKTSVLVERYVRAVIDDGIQPARVLAITFTERAAWELKERVRAKLQDLGLRELARDTEAASIGTIHAFCARLLRSDPLAAGVAPDFRILDEPTASRIQLAAFREALSATSSQGCPADLDAIAAYGPDRLQAIVLRVHAELRSHGQQAPRLPSPPGAAEAAGAGAGADAGTDVNADADANAADALGAYVLIATLLERFCAAYEARKRARGAVDFDDLELRALGMLEREPALRRRWTERFDMLMVDEFQDTNPRQLALLLALERENLFTVGDEWQSIYGFRHADVEIFRNRATELLCSDASLALTRNFRSRPAILNAVNAAFAERFGERFKALRAARPPSVDTPVAVEVLLTDTRGWEEDLPSGDALSSEPSSGPASSGPSSASASPGPASSGPSSASASPGPASSGPSSASASPGSASSGPSSASASPGPASSASASRGLPPAPAWRQAEARMIARRLAMLIDEGNAQPGEIAVLLRSMTDVALYEAALRAQGVPTSSVSAELWEACEVQDVLCWLRAIANPLDEVALHGVLAGPAIALSADALWTLSRAGEANQPSGGLRRSESDDLRRSATGDLRRTAAGDVRRSAAGGLWRSICETQETALDLPAADSARLARFQERFSQMRSEAGGHTLAALVRRAWAEARLGMPAPASVRTLARLAADFEAFEGRDLRAFVDHLAHLSQTRTPVGGQASVVDGEAVRLMSIHAAKGLEFPVVCIADLGRCANGREVPHLLVDGDRVGLRVACLDGSAPKPAFDYEQLASERALAEEQEEDRILYVAMTRAEEMLLLSGAASFERWPAQTRSAPPIAWLARTLVDELPERLARAVQGDMSARLASQGDGEEALAVCMLNAPGEIALGAYAGTTSEAPESAVLGEIADPVAVMPMSGAPQTIVRAPSADAEAALDVLSYTALSQIERCGYRHYLERVLGLQEIGPDDGRERRRDDGLRGVRSFADGRLAGLIAHRLMEGYDFARGMRPTAEEAFAAAAGIGERIGGAEAGKAVAMLSGLGETALGRRLARARSIAAEQPFCFALSGEQGSIVGTFDALAIERDGTRLVVDYKTDAVSAKDDLEQLVMGEYELQRLVYALAALRDAAGAVEVVHWFLRRPDEPVIARFGAGELELLEARLTARVAEARKRGFAVSESPHRNLCRGCPGRGGLCSWPASATMRE